MEKSAPRFEKYVLVCENKKQTGPCCGEKGGRIRERLKQKIADLKLQGKVRVSRTGCLGLCSEGPNVLVEPDHVWFKGVQEEDSEKIVEWVVSGSKL